MLSLFLGKIKLTPIKVEEFVKYCNTRRKHTIIDTLEFDKTNSRDDDSGVSYAIGDFVCYPKKDEMNNILSIRCPQPVPKILNLPYLYNQSACF